MYRVIEVAEKLGKSRTAIYDKLNNNKGLFKDHLKKVEGVRHIDNEGVEILKELFGLKVEHGTKQEEQQGENVSSSMDLLIKEMQSRINYLEKQNEDTMQILKDQTKQLENFQVLLLNEQNKLLSYTEKPKKSWLDRFRKQQNEE